MSRSAKHWAALWASLALAGAGCSDGDQTARAPSGPSMDPTAQSAAADREHNQPPRIESVLFQPESPGAGEALRAVVRASDPDGDFLRHHFRWSVNGERLAETGPRASLTRTRRGDRVEVRVTADDGRAESAPFSASTEVRNLPPRIGGVWIEPTHGLYAGGGVTAHAEARDPDGDDLTFTYTWWLNRATLPSEGPDLSLEQARRGDSIRVRVVADDGELESNSVDSPELHVRNAPPRIVSTPTDTGRDDVFHYRVRAEDADRDRPLTFSLLAKPPGMTVSSASGDIEWRPDPDQAGQHPVEVVVEDGRGGRSVQRFEVTVGSGAMAGVKPAEVPARFAEP